MDRYVRVDRRNTEQVAIQENEIRIMAAGKMRNYITYATTLLTDKGHSSIVLRAMGRAINKAVTIAEIIKRRIVGIHQNTEIGSVDITDTWEPLEEGLNRLETTRHVSVLTVTLSTLASSMDTSAPGYQSPLADDLVRAPEAISGDMPDRQGSGGRGDAGSGGQGRGRGRGSRRPRNRGPPPQRGPSQTAT